MSKLGKIFGKTSSMLLNECLYNDTFPPNDLLIRKYGNDNGLLCHLLA